MTRYAAWTAGPAPQRMDKSSRALGGLPVEASVLATHPTRDVLVVGDMSGAVTLFDPPQSEILGQLGGHQASVSRILFAPDGDHMLTAATDGAVFIWSGDGEIVHRTEATGGVLAAAVHPTTR